MLDFLLTDFLMLKQGSLSAECCMFLSKYFLMWWWGTPRYSNRLFRQTLFRQSTLGRRVADCSWIGLRAVLIGKMQNQIPKISGSTIVFEVRCNVSGGGGTPDPTGMPSPGPTPLGHFCALINAMHLMHAFDACNASTPPNFSLFLHMPKHAIDVLGCPDCELVGIASVGIVSASRGGDHRLFCDMQKLQCIWNWKLNGQHYHACIIMKYCIWSYTVRWMVLSGEFSWIRLPPIYEWLQYVTLHVNGWFCRDIYMCAISVSRQLSSNLWLFTFVSYVIIREQLGSEPVWWIKVVRTCLMLRLWRLDQVMYEVDITWQQCDLR